MSLQSAKFDRLRIKYLILFIGPMVIALASEMIFFASELKAASLSLSINDYLILDKKEIQNSGKILNFLCKKSNNQKKTKTCEISSDETDLEVGCDIITLISSKANMNIAVPDVKPVRVYHRNFVIPFNIIDAGAESADPAVEVELLYTEDYGKHWLSFGKIGAGSSRQEFFFRSRIEGEHWFTLRTWYKSGRQTMSPAQKLLIKQASPEMADLPNFTPTPNSIAPTLSKEINSKNNSGIKKFEGKTLEGKSIPQKISVSPNVDVNVKKENTTLPKVMSDSVSSSSASTALKSSALLPANSKTVNPSKVSNQSKMSDQVKPQVQSKLLSQSKLPDLPKSKSQDSSKSSDQIKLSEQSSLFKQSKLPTLTNSSSSSASDNLSENSPKENQSGSSAVLVQNSTSAMSERLSQLSVPIKISTPRNDKSSGNARTISSFPNHSKTSESVEAKNTQNTEQSRQTSSAVGISAAGKNKFDTLDIERPEDSDPLSIESKKTVPPASSMESASNVPDNVANVATGGKSSSDGNKDLSANLVLKIPSSKEKNSQPPVAKVLEKEPSLPKLDSKKLELAQDNSQSDNHPAPMNKELGPVPSITNKATTAKTPAVNASVSNKANIGSQPLTLPPLSARPKGNGKATATERTVPEDRTKQLLKIANENGSNDTPSAAEKENELMIVPGKFKNFSIGQNNTGELMIMVRWFRPEEAASPLDKLSGTLSIERSESPNGPWVSVAKELNVKEKGYWWKASALDAIPFYLRTVCVDSQGKSSIDMIPQRLELAPQLKGRVPGLPDEDKLAVRSSVPSPAPSTSGGLTSTTANADVNKSSASTTVGSQAPSDKKSNAHDTIRAWKDTAGPFDKTKESNSPFQNAGFEKSSETGATVNKTSSVQSNKLDPGYQDLKSYQPSPSPQGMSSGQGTTQRQPQSQRIQVSPPTNPNEYSLNPLFTNGFGILFQTAPSQGESSSERRSIFTSPQTWRSQNNSQTAVPQNGQNDYNNGSVYNNVGYDGSSPYTQSQMGGNGMNISSGNGANGSEMPNPGEVVYLDEKGNRIVNPFTNGMTGPNGQQYIPQNGVFVDPQTMPNGGMPQGTFSEGSMPNGQPIPGSYPDSSWQGMNYSNGPITQQDASMQFPEGMYLQDGFPQDSGSSPTGRSYFGSGNSGGNVSGSTPSQSNTPPRDYSNPQF